MTIFFSCFFLFGPSSIIGIYVWHHPLSRQSAFTAPGAKSLEGRNRSRHHWFTPVIITCAYWRASASDIISQEKRIKKKNTHKNYFGKSGNKFGREREVRKGHISHQTTLIREICHAIDSLFIIHLVFLSLSFRYLNENLKLNRTFFFRGGGRGWSRRGKWFRFTSTSDVIALMRC
jgi:hypothetical protein